MHGAVESAGWYVRIIGMMLADGRWNRGDGDEIGDDWRKTVYAACSH
jgi:hypothetical protein